MAKKYIVTALSLLGLPLATLAFDPGPVPSMTQNLSIGGLIDIIFNVLWPIVVAILIIGFILIGFLFATAQGDPEKIRTARLAVVGGVTIIIVVLLAWSIVFIVRNTVGV